MSTAMRQNKKPDKKEEAKVEDEDVDTTLSNPEVATKYRLAADIANAAIIAAKKLVVVGAKVVDICAATDAVIVDATGKLYKKSQDGKKVEKGVAFPTCVSKNEIVGHYSPLAKDSREEEATNLIQAGDIVKIDLGVHVDGYIVTGATTVAVPGEGEDAITGRRADLLMATYTAAEAALRMIKIGNTNNQVTEVITKAAEAFKCEPVTGVLSHNLSRFVIDGERVIIGKQDHESKVDEITFEANEVYAVDIVMTTGEGKPKESAERTTVYKRVSDKNYSLKMKASRSIFTEVNKDHPTFPFTTRSLDETKVRFGIVECHKHGLVQAFPVLSEKEGEFVAHVKFTMLIQNNGTVKLGLNQIDVGKVKSEYQVEDEALKAALALSAGNSKNKKKKKKKAAPKP
jgi:curved DNA binding protein